MRVELTGEGTYTGARMEATQTQSFDSGSSYWKHDKYNLAKHVPVLMRDDPVICRLVRDFKIAKFPHHIIRKIKRRAWKLKDKVVLSYEHIGSWAIANNYHPNRTYCHDELRDIGRQFLDQFCLQYNLSVEGRTLRIASLNSNVEFKAPRKPSDSFYASSEWAAVRREVMNLYSPQCMKCGAIDKIQVDHIKPRSLWPHLELSIDNCQLLCEQCNSRKSNKETSDYRSAAQKNLCRYKHLGQKIPEQSATDDDLPFEPGVFWFGQPINNLASSTRIQV